MKITDIKIIPVEDSVDLKALVSLMLDNNPVSGIKIIKERSEYKVALPRASRSMLDKTQEGVLKEQIISEYVCMMPGW